MTLHYGKVRRKTRKKGKSRKKENPVKKEQEDNLVKK